MATGASAAPQQKLETDDEIREKLQSQPESLKQRIVRRLHQIFEGHEEYLGWRQ
jgi:hypothetical protein